MEYAKDGFANRNQGLYIFLAALGKENLNMCHCFIIPVQFRIENRSGINLQSSDQWKDNFPGWVCLAVLDVHDCPNFDTCFFSYLTLSIAKPKTRIFYDTT